MDEPVKSILLAVGTITAGLLLSFASYFTGKVNSRKDASRLAIDTQSQRNRSEETFRESFAEEKVDRMKLERKVNYLLRRDKERKLEVVNLRARVLELEDKVILLTKERDDALEKLKGL